MFYQKVNMSLELETVELRTPRTDQSKSTSTQGLRLASKPDPREVTNTPSLLNIAESAGAGDGITTRRQGSSSGQVYETNNFLKKFSFILGLDDEVYFDTGKTELNSHERSRLDDLAKHIAALKEIYDSAGVEFPSIKLHGNTDIIGEESANQAISIARASSVKKFLEDKLPGISFMSYGHGESLAKESRGLGFNERNVRIESLRESGAFNPEDIQKINLLLAGRENQKYHRQLYALSSESDASHIKGSVDVTSGGTKIPAQLSGDALGDQLEALSKDNAKVKKLVELLLKIRSEGIY